MEDYDEEYYLFEPLETASEFEEAAVSVEALERSLRCGIEMPNRIMRLGMFSNLALVSALIGTVSMNLMQSTPTEVVLGGIITNSVVISIADKIRSPHIFKLRNLLIPRDDDLN